MIDLTMLILVYDLGKKILSKLKSKVILELS